jgi:hypothetical protein
MHYGFGGTIFLTPKKAVLSISGAAGSTGALILIAGAGVAGGSLALNELQAFDIFVAP